MLDRYRRRSKVLRTGLIAVWAWIPVMVMAHAGHPAPGSTSHLISTEVLEVEGDHLPVWGWLAALDSLGCIYPTACNFDASALADDGSCDFETCAGCTYTQAANYSPSATLDDGTCAFAFVDCLADVNVDGLVSVADLIILLQNFGTTCSGCAGEYDVCGVCNGPGAVFECGCAELAPGACDCNGLLYDALGVCGGDCPADEDGDGICDNVDTCVGSFDFCGVCNGPGPVYDCGCTQIPDGACNCAGQLPDAVGTCGGGCQNDLDGDGICDDAILGGCMVPVACNYDPSATEDDGSCEFDSCYGCDDPAACNFSGLVVYPNGSCIYAPPLYDCAGVCLNDMDGDGVCDALEVDGCTDEAACNFEPQATEDNGSCIYPGCTDPSYCNYDPLAGCDDGSCEGVGYPACLDSLACNFDPAAICSGVVCTYPGCLDSLAFNFDPAAGCEDGSCGYLGCMDSTACYIDLTATVEDGSCIYPGCTDSTATNFDPLAGCDDGSCLNLGCTYEYACNFDPDAEINDGSCTFGDCPGCNDPDAVNYNPTSTNDQLCWYCTSPTLDGYTYDVVVIGNQCWFAENLRTTVYANGDQIPAGLTDGEWISTTAGATAVYGEGSSGCNNLSPDIDACDEAQSLAAYGRLYNWYAVDDARGLCSEGWHVPTDGEWTELEDYITSEGFAWWTVGTALKSTYGWSEYFIGSSNGTDDFGFSALPGGYYYYYGDYGGFFHDAGNSGSWWSSSPNGGDAWYRSLYSSFPDIHRYYDDPRHGFSVRCLRDAE